MASTFTRGNPLHARCYDVVCGYQERRGLREWRRALVGDLEGEVAELGCGTGLNFPHYRAGARVFASDLDPVMMRRAIPRAAAAPATISLFVADAMALPLPDRSVDTIVIGLMLCSVSDALVAIGEIKRVLRPGGVLRFVEHVRGREGTFLARLQDTVNPAWRFVSGGCNCNRRPITTTETAGFEISRLYEFSIGRTHIAPHVMVEARAA